MRKIAKDIYVEAGFAGVTVGAVVTADGVICIDAPTHPEDARQWKQRLAKLSPGPILYVISLNHHIDRTLGNQWLAAPVIAHEAAYERSRLLPDTYRISGDAGADSELSGDQSPRRPITPQVTFTDRMTLQRGGRTLQLVHRPGPTAGSIWVELPEEQVVFVGDAATNGVPPFLNEADVPQWLEQLAELRKARFPARIIVPGRGAPLKKDRLRATVNFIKAAERKAEALARARKPRSDLNAAARDLLRRYTAPASQRDHLARRIRLGLEYLYELHGGPAR